MIFFLREAFSSAIASVTGILPTLADKADYSKVRTTGGGDNEGRRMKTGARCRYRHQLVRRRNQKRFIRKTLGVHEGLFFGGG